jgi:tetratricopeptide (TPR) repeat protein
MRRSTDAQCRRTTARPIREDDTTTVWLAVGLIFMLTIVTYLPTMRGDRLWDDQAHITREGLRSADGLWRIWFELGATQQYYPLLHTAFWIEQKLRGDSLLGYHLTKEAHHRYGVALLNSGYADKAARELEEAARLLPYSSKIQSNWGVALFTAGWLTEATRVFQAAIELDPEFLVAYDNLVRAQMQSGDAEAAVATAERALDAARATGQATVAERIDDWLRTTRARDMESPQAD